MPRYTIHPWRTPADLLAVRAQLYQSATHFPHSDDDRRQAVTRILTCWKLRGNLPHAVESTALLIDAQLHHRYSSEASDFAVRATYTAAFTRFVTGFCDIGRSREGLLQPSSMLDVARRIGMPVHFVGLRHEAVHEELPSLGRLIGIVDQALAWLWDVYWSRLPEKDVSGVAMSIEDMNGEARRLFKAYRSSRREAFRAKRQKTAEHEAEIEQYAQACNLLWDQSNLEECVKASTAVLVDERFIFPSSRELGDSMAGAFTLWDPLLRRLARSQRTFIRALTESLQAQLAADTAQSSGSAINEATALWLLHTLELATNGAMDGELKASVMRTCCLYPGYWMQMVGQRLLDGNEMLSNDWQDLFEAGGLTVAEEQKASYDRQEAGDAGVEGMTGNISGKAGASRTLPPEDEMAATGWRRAPFAPYVPIGIAAQS
ncbi:rRNA-processing protein las1 [Elasticomyces elasticus]|nr:rRNA-processing protein las1 [Elasticomyces elasticus]KAK3624874.1 rRNA-processing protein las1 [Elasticomyces elasticus]KAK4906560.1 rRNA-processing protein las1 [Elasticomyces elasticus]KAK5745385.1 rRNA-processing protein las1 [Elasticomyces elasticus]